MGARGRLIDLKIELSAYLPGDGRVSLFQEEFKVTAELGGIDGLPALIAP